MNYYSYIAPFLISFFIVVGITPLIRKFAIAQKIVDNPKDNPERKIQKSSIPLLGGLAIFIGFTVVLFYYTFFTDRMLGGYMLEKHIIGIIIAGVLLMLGGYLDDKYDLKPFIQLIWPILAAIVIIASGIGISYISSPFGGTLNLDSVKFELFKISDIPYSITLWADLIAFVWLMVMVYTTKFLDGLDGLVPGIGTIAAIIIFALSLTNNVAQPETALLSVIFAGALAGFLVFSFHPAKIFLGEGGSTFIGFILGVLAIISGAKIATALLIMGVPLLDVAWVILRRVIKEKRSPFWGDKKHLHFRLLDIGLSHRQSVIFLYGVTGAFGITSLFLSTKGKLIAMIVLAIAMVILGLTLVFMYKRKSRIVS